MKGVWLVVIGDKTAIVHAKFVMDGGMVEFTDAVTGVLRGCAGINWWNESGHAVRYTGTLPAQQEGDKWL